MKGRKKGDLKQPVSVIVDGEHITYKSVSKACSELGIDNHRALRYFRNNPDKSTYTSKSGITLTKTQLI